MPIDARISMGLRPQTYDAFAAYDTGRQNEQTFRTNQMAQQAAQATADRNVLARQRLAALRPDDDAGFSALVSEFGDNPLIAAVGTNRNRMRDDARAVETQRLAVEKAERERDDYSIQTSLPDWVNASRNPDDATLNAAMARALARPGVNADLIQQTFGSALAMPQEDRAAYMADIANSYTQSRAARAAQYPDIRTINYGSTIGGLPNSDPTALTAPIPERAVTMTPGQVQTQQNRDVDRYRRLDDAQVVLDADAEAAQAEAAALAANPRADRDAVAAAQAQAAAAAAAATANRRLRSGPAPRPAQTAPAADRGSPPPAPPAGTPRGATRSNARGTWTWDGSRWQ
jgi:hypothetical protein